ncbi:MAG TPA: 1-deoxy-D-xylulose-5-phosphate reductoisomerase [Alphaproteobacteria bacterium]
MFSVSILGSTGSIGTQTLDLIAHHKHDFQVVVLSANKNADLLIQQAKQFNPKFVAIADESQVVALRDALPGIEVAGGAKAIEQAGQMDADITFAGIVGMAGLLPTMAAIKRGKTVAFASKECLAAAGPLMMDAVKKSGTTLLPVDSEHNAIFQVFDQNNANAVRRIILTASGGPFLNMTRAQMANMTPAQALKHPTWTMGRKISIDSATLMNKSLEVIEAHYLFDKPSEQIDIVIHPQSVVHSMVEYNDGSILAQMGASDMRTPLAVCLGWPNRIETCGERLDISKLSQLTFTAPDTDQFPALKIVRDVLAGPLSRSIAFNAANEVAVAAFLDGKIGFNDIVDTVAHSVQNCPDAATNSIEDVIALDGEIRAKALSSLKIAA